MTAGPDIALSLDCPDWLQALPEVEAICRAAALSAIDEDSADGLDIGRLEVSIALVDDATIQDLNARYRGQDKPTNVLSFASLDEEEAVLPEDGPLLLGDVVVAFQTTAREAGEEGKPLVAHLSHLVVHGVLHLLGYDHEEEGDATVMEAKERLVLAKLGLPDPYAAKEEREPLK